MTIALVNHIQSHGPGNWGPTAAVDMTGADLLVAAVIANIGTPAFDDGMSGVNNWILQFAFTGDFAAAYFWYCKKPIVGSSMVFTTNSADNYGTLLAAGFKGTDTGCPFDTFKVGPFSNGTASSGSMTPNDSNELVLAMFAGWATDTNPPAGFTALDIEPGAGGSYSGGGFAYKIQSGAPTAENPTWNVDTNTNTRTTAAVACFRPLVSGAPSILTPSNAFHGGTAFPQHL